MDKIKPIEALHIAGSVASVTAISLLALDGLTTDNQFATIVAYSMSASIFIGVLALLVFGFRTLYPKVSTRFGSGVAIASSAIVIPLLFWLNIYLIIILKSLAKYELLWLFEQVAR